MKKVLKSLVFALLVLMPIGVLAAPTFELDCPAATAKKGDTVSCTLKVKSVGGDATLTGVTGTYTGDTKFTSASNGNIYKNGLSITSTGNVENISVIAGQIAGTGTISVTITAATGTTTVPASCSDEQYTTKAECEAQEGLTWTEASTTPVDLISSNVVANDTIKILDNDTTITSVKTDGVDNTNCDTNATTCSLSTNKASIKTEVNVAPSATKSGDGTLNLSCGNNTQKVTIKAEDGGTKSYTFTVTRTCDNNTSLKGITISTGSLNPTFSASTKSYKVEVSSDIDKITINGTKAVDSQTITGNVTNKALTYGDNKFTITVKSEKGDTSTYVITVTRKDDRSEDNSLKSITLSEGKLKPNFSKDVVEYKVKVLYEVEKIKVTAETTDSKATIEYVDNEKTLVVGDNTILIKVKSENQKEKIYKVIVTKLKEGETLGDNPNLVNLTVKDYDLGFSYNKNNYTLKIEKEDKLDIKVTAEESTSTYKIKSNSNLKNGSVITITVTSQDGTTKDYTITIEKSNIILFIIIAGVTLVVAIGLIVYLVIKNKKGKDSFTTTKVKKQLKHDDEILAKVQNQLNEIEKTAENPIVTPTTPVTINPEPKAESAVMQAPIIRTQYTEQPRQEEKPVLNNEPKTEATRVCSICGHRVSVTLNTCPYCKRSF